MKSEMQLVRLVAGEEIYGKDILMGSTEESVAAIQSMPYGKPFPAVITHEPMRSLHQLNLFYACAQLVSENTDDVNWNTKNKVVDQVKISQRWIKSWMHYTVGGKEHLHLELKSISFKDCPHLEACGFFTEAMKIMAGVIGVSEDKLVSLAQERMRSATICPLCGKHRKLDKHHRYSQGETHEKVYSKKLLDMDFNIYRVCNGCHLSKPIPVYSEREFLKAAIGENIDVIEYVSDKYVERVRDLFVEIKLFA
jgi:hypothetical protein